MCVCARSLVYFVYLQERKNILTNENWPKHVVNFSIKYLNKSILP